LTIGLHPEMEHGPQPGRSESLSIGFTVDNLTEEMSNLKSKGIIFSPNIVEGRPVRIAFFTDPDETLLYLCEVQDEKH